MKSQRMVIATGMAKSVMSLMLSTLPVKCEEGKWGKTSSCLDFWESLWVPNGLLAPLLLESGKRLVMIVAHIDPSVPLHKLTHAEAQGVRYKDAVELCADGYSRFKLTVILICSNSTRLLHYQFFKSSRNILDPTEWPLYLDLINPLFSVTVVSLQYLAAIIHGCSPMLILVWDGHDSLIAWADENPKRATLLRVSAYAAATSIHRRHCLRTPLDTLLSLCDTRVPMDDRRCKARGFKHHLTKKKTHTHTQKDNKQQTNKHKTTQTTNNNNNKKTQTTTNKNKLVV